MTLAEFLASWARRPFEWGSTDCAQFAAAWVVEATGKDHRAAYAYTDEAGAARVIAEAGGLADLVTRHLGPFQRSRQGMAPGDVVLSAFDRGPTLGIAVTPRLFVLRGPQGLVPIQAEFAIGHWKLCPSQ